MGRILHACMWLAESTTASKHYQIWTTHHELIASWCPYKEMHRGKQCHMCLLLFCTCPVLPDSYEFQSTHNLALAGYFTYWKLANTQRKYRNMQNEVLPHCLPLLKTSIYKFTVKKSNIYCQSVKFFSHNTQNKWEYVKCPTLLCLFLYSKSKFLCKISAQ